MSMLSLQVDGLRKAANRMEEIGISVGHDNTASAFITHDAVERMREAAYTIESLLDRLQPVPAELDYVEDKSRWHELFGTPERAARTTYDMHECSLGMPIECDDCAAKPICASGANDYDALLEWLRGDITDERYTDLGLCASGNLRDDFENWASLNLKAMAHDLLSPNPFKTLEERREIVEKYKREIVDVLLEWLRGDAE